MRTLLTETLSSIGPPQKGQSPFPIGLVKRFRLCFTTVPRAPVKRGDDLVLRTSDFFLCPLKGRKVVER